MQSAISPETGFEKKPLTFINSKNLNAAAWICGWLFFCIYFFILFVSPLVVHEEILLTFVPMLKSGDVSILQDAIAKSFNLLPIENGAYRPRILTFLIHYMDVNSSLWLTRVFPAWNMHFPMVFISDFLLLYFAYKILCLTPPPRKNQNRGIAFLMAVSLLFTPALFTTNLIILRSGKIMEAAVSLALLYVFLRMLISNAKYRTPVLALIILLLFFGMTSGEQAVAMAAFLFALSLAISAIKRKIQASAWLFGSLCLLYLLWHLAIGPIIFQHFTPQPIVPHPHKYEQAFYNFFYGLIPGLALLWENLEGFFTLAPTIILAIIYCAWLIWGASRNRLVTGAIMLAPLFLADAIICSHKSIWFLPPLREHMYSIALISISACLLYFALLSCRLAKNRFFALSIIIFLCPLCSWHLAKTKEYGQWLYAEQGFMKPMPFNQLHAEFKNSWVGIDTDNIIFMIPKPGKDWGTTRDLVTDIIKKMRP